MCFCSVPRGSFVHLGHFCSGKIISECGDAQICNYDQSQCFYFTIYWQLLKINTRTKINHKWLQSIIIIRFKVKVLKNAQDSVSFFVSFFIPVSFLPLLMEIICRDPLFWIPDSTVFSFRRPALPSIKLNPYILLQNTFKTLFY